MGQDERNRIEFMLGCGNNVASIAKALGRSESTISRELLNRRIDSNKHYGCSNRLCGRFDDCARTAFNGFRDIRRKNSPGCFESCPDFREAVCVRLNRAPYVCNGCEREHNCPLKKRYYIASGAQANYRGVLVNCRSGVRPNEAMVRMMGEALAPAARQGQSVDAVIAGNPELFGGYSRSTVYGWIGDGLFAAKKHDLPFAGTRRRPRKKPETKTNARCRIGRTHADLLEWLKANPDVVPTEADTVIGSVSGKVLFTFMVRNRLPLAFLRDAKTSQTFTRIVNMLWEVAGPELFRKLFRCIVPDNGTEFSDPEMVENYRPDPGHNPHRLLPRGARVFYCGPVLLVPEAAHRALPPGPEAHSPERRIVQPAQPGSDQPDHVAPEQLSEALSRRKGSVRPVRRRVRCRGEEVPRQARHRPHPAGRGDAASLPARAQVPEGGRQGGAQEERSARTEGHGKVK